MVDELLVFSEDAEEPENINRKKKPWKILIIDDEVEIHKMTMGVLGDFSFEGRYLEFLNAHTTIEAKETLNNNSDIALVLLDVVMETDVSGLELVKYIRETLGNSFIRIVLRTGQPGLAPEKKVIVDYDINDYKSKTELTVQKLYTTIISSLRSYKGLRVIEKSRIGLEKIIQSTAKLYEIQSFQNFTSGVLIQLLSLLNLDEDAFLCRSTGFTASTDEGHFVITAAAGKYEKWINKPLNEILDDKLFALLDEVEQGESDFFEKSVFIDKFNTRGGCEHLLYMERDAPLNMVERNLIKIFSKNIAQAYESIYDRMNVQKAEHELITKLAQTIVERSIGKADNHIVRKAKFTYLLAKSVGMDEEEALLLEKTTPLYDIGMISISESIHMKTGKLSNREVDQLKAHPKIGYDILINTEHAVAKAASITALQHQEKWNGTGYPNGLKGEEIHIYGRIGCFVDVFDALIHKRRYKESLSMDEAAELIKKERGEHFDPNLVDSFFANLDQFVAINDEYPETTIE